MMMKTKMLYIKHVKKIYSPKHNMLRERKGVAEIGEEAMEKKVEDG
jgi:hypothetical protein